VRRAAVTDDQDNGVTFPFDTFQFHTFQFDSNHRLPNSPEGDTVSGGARVVETQR
jgi:hypothetical protein